MCYNTLCSLMKENEFLKRKQKKKINIKKLDLQ